MEIKHTKSLVELENWALTILMLLKRKVNLGKMLCNAGSAGHRARVPPDPIPNSEVKPRSVPCCIVVFGHEKLGKLATPKHSFRF
jgi:hypothetical protein